MFNTVACNKLFSAVIKSSADNGERGVGRNSSNLYSTGILREGGKKKRGGLGGRWRLESARQTAASSCLQRLAPYFADCPLLQEVPPPPLYPRPLTHRSLSWPKEGAPLMSMTLTLIWSDVPVIVGKTRPSRMRLTQAHLPTPVYRVRPWCYKTDT